MFKDEKLYLKYLNACKDKIGWIGRENTANENFNNITVQINKG